MLESGVPGFPWGKNRDYSLDFERQIMGFDHLGLMPALLGNVRDSGYTEPTPIQSEVIPLVLQGRDVLGCAQTGTGKTAAFALPILQLLEKKRAAGGPRALILTPTRELAQQNYDNIVGFGKGLHVRAAVVYGGVSQVHQVEELEKGCDILIACPGRLWDLMQQKLVSLDRVEIYVLDEADRMLDMGFIHDVRRITPCLPARHQTLLFSATMPSEVESLAMDLLREPERVAVDPVSSAARHVEQYMYYVDKVNKKYLLAEILKRPEVENALVFSRTKHGCDKIVRDLKRAGIEAVAIHGDKTQGARQNALNRFKSGDCRVMIATDIAARGLDIEGLSHVINYDLPMEPEAYVHRIGRTGRAGHDGTAISFCCIDEMKQLNQVEKLIGFRLSPRESAWPLENKTPTPPRPRMPRPTNVNREGQPVSEARRQKAAATAAVKGARRGPVTIGRDGHVQGGTRTGLPRPVQRINRKKGSGM